MIVVDCSFLIDLLVRPSTVGFVDASQEWCAPELLDVEIVSALRGMVLGGHIERETAAGLLRDYRHLGIRLWSLGPELQARMLELADVVTAYDAAYVVLAEVLDAPLLTHDRRLAAAASRIVTVLP